MRVDDFNVIVNRREIWATIFDTCLVPFIEIYNLKILNLNTFDNSKIEYDKYCIISGLCPKNITRTNFPLDEQKERIQVWRWFCCYIWGEYWCLAWKLGLEIRLEKQIIYLLHLSEGLLKTNVPLAQQLLYITFSCFSVESKQNVFHWLQTYVHTINNCNG